MGGKVGPDNVETQAWSPPDQAPVAPALATTSPVSISTIHTPSPTARNLLPELEAAPLTPDKPLDPKPRLPAPKEHPAPLNTKPLPPAAEHEPAEAIQEDEAQEGFDVAQYEACNYKHP